MKLEKNLIFLIAVCIFSYSMMVNHSMTAGAEDIHNYYNLPQEQIVQSYIYDLKDSYFYGNRLTQYIENLTGLDTKYCEFIVAESKEKDVDPFIVLGVIKRESDFNPCAEGADGERGLGQLMDNTASVISNNLGYEYSYDRLLDPGYNLKLTITQLSYLKNVYDEDMHMALTAYNRGQQGLLNYIESTGRKTGASDYSVNVQLFASKYKEAFENY